MKVCKKVRLLEKDAKGLFKKDGASQVVRNRAIISEQDVKESELNYADTGLLWIIDEKATKERDEQINSKVAKKATKEKNEEAN